MEIKSAIVEHVSESGLIYARVSQGELVGFSFGKVTGYKGESSKEMSVKFGIKSGNAIRLFYDDEMRLSAARVGSNASVVDTGLELNGRDGQAG